MNINHSQIIWYGVMLSEDLSDQFEKDLNMAEYIASFINPEAVSRIKAERENKKNKRFMDDQQFEEMIKNKDFLKVEYPLGKTANNIPNNEPRKSARETRLPKELSGILKINRDNF